MAKILVVEDDPQIRKVLKMSLERAEFEVFEAGDGLEGLKKAQSGRYDLIVLDVGLPEMDGLQICQRLRQDSEVPILFLSARDEEVDRILGLEFGADDYVTKPFSTRELVARIRAILKRSQNPSASPSTNLHKRGVLTVDSERRNVSVNGKPLQLTARELGLLEYLIRYPDHVHSKSQIIDAVYGEGYFLSDRTLDSHIRNLRTKLSDEGCENAIVTVHGVGIRMGSCASL